MEAPPAAEFGAAAEAAAKAAPLLLLLLLLLLGGCTAGQRAAAVQAQRAGTCVNDPESAMSERGGVRARRRRASGAGTRQLVASARGQLILVVFSLHMRPRALVHASRAALTLDQLLQALLHMALAGSRCLKLLHSDSKTPDRMGALAALRQCC